MLSFLQQRFGKILIQPEKKMMHQQSIESAFSRVTARHSSNDASTTPSMTTATSLTDTPIQLTKCSVKPVEHKCNSARLPATIDNYNEDVLSANNTSSSRKVGDEVDERIISGDTLVDDHNDDGNKSREHLLQQCVQALGEDWDIGAMPGDELRLSENKERPSKRRKSTRLELLGKKSGMNEKTTSVLGKRGCETVDAGIEKFQALKGATIRSALRPRISETPNSEGPSRKRARFSNLEIIKRNPPEPVVKRVLSKKPVKRWLDQGLYVGQDPDFDPRLTETKNKLKKASINCSGTPKRTLMQLPMFAGDRTLAMGRNFRLPFDIFSPLPPGQPKPDEWKKTQKSRWSLPHLNEK